MSVPELHLSRTFDAYLARQQGGASLQQQGGEPVEELEPGECITRFASSCSGPDCTGQEETVCNGAAAVEPTPVPLTGTLLPLTFLLLAVGAFLRPKRRRLGQLVLAAAFLSVFSLPVMALRHPSGLTARCDYYGHEVQQGYLWEGQMYTALTYSRAVTDYRYFFEFNTSRWNTGRGRLTWLYNDLQDDWMGVAYVSWKASEKWVKSCEIQVDPQGIWDQAGRSGGDPWYLLEGTWIHEMGHCLGLQHYNTPASGEGNRSAMNYSMNWRVGDLPNWMRYANNEVNQLMSDFDYRNCL